MALNTMLRISSVCLLFVGFGVGVGKDYGHAAFLVAIAIYMRVWANEEDQ